MDKEPCQRMTKIQEGIKFDADKPRLSEMFLDFTIPLELVTRVWEFGAQKYGKSNWKYVTNARNRYTNALLRHLAKETENEYDDETNLLHAAHVAWNALARLYFIALNNDPVVYKKFLNEILEEAAPGAPASEIVEGHDIIEALNKKDEEERSYKQLSFDLKSELSKYHDDYNFDT